MKLTKCDSDIYTHFRDEFPDVKVDVIDVDAMKSAEGKEVSYKEKVQMMHHSTIIIFLWKIFIKKINWAK